MKELKDPPEFETNAGRFAAIVESSDDAIISKSLDGTITSWNQAAQRMFGYTAEEIVGKPISVLMPPERHDDLESILGRIRKGERVEHYETVRVAKDGHRIDVSVSVSPVKDRNGRIVGAAKIARDISKRRRLEAERQRLLREAQQGVQLRDIFLTVAGHELRTPLNALKLQLYNLERKLAVQGHRDAVAKAQREVDRLTALTVRLLDVARMAAGGFEVDRAPMDLAALAREAAARFEQAASTAGSPIKVEAPGPVIGAWDRTSIDQVVTNLLTNAVKFGGGGPIDVRVEKDGGTARVRVRDRGPGVAESDRQRIFERFERGVSERSYGGLGLGLWIARQIVTAHGGRIEVESAPGQGATFTFELPIEEGGWHADPARG
ncbi:MAG TPA: PAS domain-containing sensor histidine kinase [Thermoanaerobaculia bacterium]|nr:PAS domain-containing sensor histidine kinase [Thermoanaerobaculia bacterium]